MISTLEPLLLQGEDGEELLDENLESLHPPKMKRTHSRNGDLLGGEQVGNTSTIVVHTRN